MNNTGKNLILWLVIGLLLVFVFRMFEDVSTPESMIDWPFSEFMVQVEQGNVEHVTIKGQHIEGETTSGQAFTTFSPEGASIVDNLIGSGVQIKAAPDDSDKPTFFTYLLTWFPLILLIAIWIFLMRQMQGGGGGKAMGFGKSRARLLAENTARITFDDVAGVDEAKEEVSEIVEYLRDPSKFQKLGGKIPKGVLLVGAPGTGKTLLGRAIAGEANVPFFSISGSDFVEMFVGVGASRVRDMFEQGKHHAPCLIFIDEIDAVGRHRGAGLGGGNDEREQTLNQLLVEMDGFETNEGVILIAATNRPDVLDPALTRPGRFDRQVMVPFPDLKGRDQILNVHMRKIPLAPDVVPNVIARGSPGMTGADLANLVNEAALLAARRNRSDVSMSEFEDARDKVLMGPERNSLVMSDKEKSLTAYHESGHALVSVHMEHSDPIHKATIMPRGRALGMVEHLPERDEYGKSRAQLEDLIAISMGGRIAEEIIFGRDNVTTGAQSDIEHATSLARRMVTEWGMSDTLGPMAYAPPEQEVFLGHSVTQHKNISEDTARMVDEEIHKILIDAYERAKGVITGHMDDLRHLAENLREYETLTGEEIKIICNGGTIDRPESPPPPPPKKTKPVVTSKASVPTGGGESKTE